MRKYSYSATRRVEVIVLRLLLLALVGTICGALLGEMVAGQRLSSGSSEPAAYSRLSANPDAAATPAIGADACIGCPDSYGVAARLRAERRDRMDGAFRALGSAEPEVAADDIDDGYRYGGSFPGSEPRSRYMEMEPLDAVPTNVPPQEDQAIPSVEMLTPSAEAP